MDDINNVEDLEIYLVDYLCNNVTYSNFIYDTIDGDSFEEYDFYESDIIFEDGFLDSLKYLIKSNPCCKDIITPYCPTCGTKNSNYES